jgi:hypothetical protein
MMTGQAAPKFNQVPSPYRTTQQKNNIVHQPYNTAQPQYNTAQPQYNIMQYNQAPLYNALRGDRASYRGGGRARGGFGRGRGPVVLHNYKKLGHYARECPLPPTTCMYSCTLDHDTEECLTLLVKIQEKRNQNNQNVQWISAEVREEGRNINIVMRGGTKTGNNVARQEPVQHQWVNKNAESRRQFDA